MNSEKPVLLEIQKGIAIITLNRPEKKNSLNQAALTAFFNHIDEVDSNDDIRVAIITGSGNSFCAGLDLGAFGKEELIDVRGDGRILIDIMLACRKPIIGAINGYAITGGFELALLCDLLIAGEEASFADTHVKYGLHPAWGITQILQRIVGQPMAKQISFTGEFITAQKALSLGLVNEVVPNQDLLPRAKEIAGAIAAANQEALATVKKLVERGGSVALDEGLAMERKGFDEWYKRVRGL
jgi:enoyl-CoA hydratase